MNDMLAAITWRPRIGDPSPMDWGITAIYFLGSVICFLTARTEPQTSQHERGRHRRFWLALAVMMLALGLNKQLDLQTLLTQVGREIARSGGWYGQRRVFQAAFVFNCVVLGAIFAGVGWRMLRGQSRVAYLAYLGVVFLITFVVLRAASFHHIDTVLYRLPGLGRNVNFGLELVGVLIVTTSGFMSFLQHRTVLNSGSSFRSSDHFS